MKPSVFLLFIAIILFTACSKDKDETNEHTCSRDNYAITSVSYGSTATAHNIGINYPNGSHREKISPKGASKDTLHLPPGTYGIAVANTMDNRVIIEDKYFPNITLAQCEEKALAVEH